MDANNLSLSRALADFDIRQKMSLSLLYETPKIRGQDVVADLLSRWQLGTVTILQSGTSVQRDLRYALLSRYGMHAGQSSATADVTTTPTDSIRITRTPRVSAAT